MTAPMATIRLAREEDAAAMLAIYAPYVRDTAISFETEPPSEEEFRQRVRATLEVGLWILCEAGGSMLGYAYGGRFHPRRAYQWTVEVTVYVHQEHHRKGVGLGLYTSLLRCLAPQGFRGAGGAAASRPASHSCALRGGTTWITGATACARRARAAAPRPRPSTRRSPAPAPGSPPPPCSRSRRDRRSSGRG